MRAPFTTLSTAFLGPCRAIPTRSRSGPGFRKRVLSLEPETLGADRVGPAVDRPAFADAVLRTRVSQLHAALRPHTEALEAHSRLAFVLERLGQHLDRAVGSTTAVPGSRVADALRELLDARVVDGVDLSVAAVRLGVTPTHLVRAFTRRHGLPPHRYLTGRRVDLARRLLLDGMPAAEVATAAGFYD